MIRLSFCLGIIVVMLTGCDATPAPVPCVVTNPYSITINYSCEDGTYRCTNADGSTKYKDCQYGDAYCVEDCK